MFLSTAEVLGPQDSPNVYADSVLAWAPTSVLGDTVGMQTGGDSWISFAHNTWASFLNDGYTEYIEVSS
jgi:hypothetical protein